MRKILLSIYFACGLLLINSSPVQAISIELLPQYQDVDVNAPVDIDVMISGLGDGTAPSLGTFDLSIFYDSALLSLGGVGFGGQLDLFGLGSLQSVDDSVPGVVNLFELSFDLPDDLENFQLPSFILATLTFDTILVGTSTLTVEVNELGDAYGAPLMAELNGAQINASAVPIPGAFWLFYSGLACLITMRRRKKLLP